MELASILFFLIGATIALIEVYRTNVSRPDLLSFFVFIFFVQVIVPGVFIPGLLVLSDGAPHLGNHFFDRIYRDVTSEVVIISALMSAQFAFALYVGFFWSSRAPGLSRVAAFISIKPSLFLYGVTMLIGIVSSLVLLGALADGGLLDKYSALILFRAQDLALLDSRNFLTANLFSLTQTFAVLSVVGLFVAKDLKAKGGAAALILIACLIIFTGLMTASRRGLAIQFLIIYFTFVLMRGRWYISSLVLFSFVFFPVLIFGKEVLAQIALGHGLDDINFSFNAQGSVASALNGFSSLGITLNSSWATFIYLDEMRLRFGIDHLFSALRFLPLGSFGVDEDALFPQRIVRTSTEVFVGSEELDIPPGLIGQMWLDWGGLGSVVWGGVFGIIVGWLQAIFRSQRKNFSNVCLFVILTFVIALPLNSGSLDYNFSVDIFAIVFALFAIFKIKRGRGVGFL